MKKQLLTLVIGIIIGTTITATASYVYTANDIDYTPTDSEWNVSNASEALSSLKSDLNTVSTDVSTYKSEIITTLNNNGSELTNSSTMGEIQNTITELLNAPNALVYKEDFNYTTNSSKVFDFGFEPDIVIIHSNETAGGYAFETYIKSESNSKFWSGRRNGTGYADITTSSYLRFNDDHTVLTYVDPYCTGSSSIYAAKVS